MKYHLPNYDKYLLKLKSLMKVLNIKLLWQTNPSDGAWLPSKRAIVVDPDLTEQETIATILHELGHIIDDFSVDLKTLAKIDKAYSFVYTDYYSHEDVIIVSLAERRAWNYGIAIAKNINIRLGKWYNKAATSGVRDYKKLTKKAAK